MAVVSAIGPRLVTTEQQDAEQTTTTVSQVVKAAIAPPVKLPSLQPIPGFWDELARCETNSDWDNGGNWAGGLGIARSTWSGWGGHEFAKTPDKATKEELIVVATRVAITGYKRPDGSVKEPVGFGGWGALPCAGGKPKLIAHEMNSVIRQKFMWGQSGRLVKDLQAIIDVKPDGKYGVKTYSAHIRYVIQNRLNPEVLPTPKLKQPKRVPASSLKKCNQFREIAQEAGFPKSEIENTLYVMWKESRCQTNAANRKDPHGGSYGLMQINAVWKYRLTDSGIIKTLKDLYDPKINIKAALFVWTYSIDNRGYGWHPWGLY